MPLQFYKPNSSNKGTACSISFNSKEQKMYISLIKQVSWDADKRVGSFKGGVSKVFKFSETEVGGLIYAIENNVEQSFFHGTFDKVGISFGPYVVEGEQRGFGLKVNSTAKETGEKLSFVIGFTFAEAVRLREHFIFILHHFSSAVYSKDKKAFEDKNGSKVSKPSKSKETEEVSNDFGDDEAKSIF